MKTEGEWTEGPRKRLKKNFTRNYSATGTPMANANIPPARVVQCWASLSDDGCVVLREHAIRCRRLLVLGALTRSRSDRLGRLSLTARFCRRCQVKPRFLPQPPLSPPSLRTSVLPLHCMHRGVERRRRRKMRETSPSPASSVVPSFLPSPIPSGAAALPFIAAAAAAATAAPPLHRGKNATH